MTANPITGTISDDNLQGTARRDIIDCLAGNDWVVLAGGHDTVFGRDGNDSVFGYFGGDVLRGAAGDDQLSATSSVEADPSRLFGGMGNDRLFVSGSGSAVYGGSGDDQVVVYIGLGLAEAAGGAGSDHLNVSALFGGIPVESSFFIRAAGPDATVLADGIEVLAVSGFEQLDVTLRQGDDTVIGTGLADRIDLSDGANHAKSRGGDDWMAYRQGSRNVLDGGDGTDRLVVNAPTAGGAVVLIVGQSNATDGSLSKITGFEHYLVIGGLGGDSAWLGARSDRFLGYNGADQAFGGRGADRFLGGKGQDSLVGGAGADHLNGGDGRDVLTGGAGDDRFVFGLLDGKADRITDFASGTDKIITWDYSLGRALPEGPLDESALQIGQAQGNGPQFVLRPSGLGAWNELIFDANGQDAGGELSIALLSDTAVLLASDILIL